MPNVVSNTSCLIALANIGLLGILSGVYGSVLITPEVAQEFGEKLPDWIYVVPVRDQGKIGLIDNILDLGEASSIALAMETENVLLVLDDGKARRFAASLNLKITGTLGVIARVYKLKLIDSLEFVINKLRGVGFRVPNNIEQELLWQAQS